MLEERHQYSSCLLVTFSFYIKTAKPAKTSSLECPVLQDTSGKTARRASVFHDLLFMSATVNNNRQTEEELRRRKFSALITDSCHHLCSQQ